MVQRLRLCSQSRGPGFEAGTRSHMLQLRPSAAKYIQCSLRPHGLHPARLLCPGDSPGKNTGMGCHAFLQGIVPTQGSNPGLLHCRQILCQLSYQGNPIYIYMLHAKSLQSCLTLCDPMDGSLPGSSVHGIFQARILEWVSTSFSKGSF